MIPRILPLFVISLVWRMNTDVLEIDPILKNPTSCASQGTNLTRLHFPKNFVFLFFSMGRCEKCHVLFPFPRLQFIVQCPNTRKYQETLLFAQRRTLNVQRSTLITSPFFSKGGLRGDRLLSMDSRQLLSCLLLKALGIHSKMTNKAFAFLIPHQRPLPFVLFPFSYH